MDKVDKNTIPKISEIDFVADADAYEKYKQAKKNPFLNERKNVTASNGKVYFLGTVDTSFRKMISGLPEPEQEKLLSYKRLYSVAMGKVSAYKRKAFASGGGKMGSSMLDNKAAEIIDLFGRMMTLTEVHEIVTVDWGMDCSLETISNFRKKHVSVISKKIDTHKSDWTGLRLSHKRSRIEEMVWFYTKFKRKYEKAENRGDAELALKTLEQIKREVEGDKFVIQGKVDMNVEGLVNIHLQQQVFKDMNIGQIVLSRIATKQQVDPLKFLTMLTNSYYSKFNGVMGNDTEDADYEEIKYPSEQHYDFDKIRLKASNDLKNQMLTEQIQKEQPAPKQVERKATMRDILLNKIKLKQSKVDETMSRIGALTFDKGNKKSK